MRTGPRSSINSVSRMTAVGATTVAKATFAPPAAAAVHRSPWHSPVPYLFGGLAAMLGLIAFALLVLACSYWRRSVGGGGDDDDRRSDMESGAAEKGESGGDAKATPVFEEKILVIMAGEVKPTFLATPMTSKNSSFNEEKESSEKITDDKEETLKKRDETTSDNEESPAQ
ncbi:protein GLUTAMINE DUMPER 5-like [Andrographis paniculata]|uniref:protein GLUTAMINE DUMPER 5-like n=1 Tax=Andrographis paniculata TaxID=175694 RepID=UPI0021E8C593|nr:protein GLUTAMINE DUMPER 5-like [Andrographis paniculata]